MDMKRFYQISVILCATIFVVLIVIFLRRPELNCIANNGVVDFTNYNFKDNGVTRLNGEWDLFFGELLMPDEIETMKANTYYNIPGRLSDQINGIRQGYMTLHLKIYVPKDEAYGAYFNRLFTSSDIWVNGEYLSGHGKVSKDAKSEKAIYRSQYIFFPSVNKEIDIVIHTSTYRDIEPWLAAATFGTKHPILKLMYKNVAIDGITIGIMFIMGFFSFGFYFTKPKQKINIYFASICFIMLIRCLVFNSRLIVQFYPNIIYEVLSKISAITFYLSVTMYILFLDEMFENRFIIRKIAVIYGVGFSVLCLVTENMIYDRFGVIAQIIVALFTIYIFVFLIKEIRRKNQNAVKNIIPFIVLSITGINDALVNNAVLYNSYIALYGVIIYIIAQSLFIVDDYLEKHRLLDYVNRDGLTSLYNNKYIKEILSRHLKRHINSKEKFSLLMIDIDDFKGVNDQYGHMFGDTVLIDVAKIIHEVSDDKGYAGRLGGDEFIILLPKTSEKDAMDFAKRIMNRVEDMNNKYEINKKISVSIGVYENDEDDLIQCIDKVDKSMYKAKTLGKNCISI